MNTSEAEFRRVVRHETGHTLGCPHEHMRRELVDRIDVEKAVEYFAATQGWSREEVYQQVLTPLEDASLIGTDSTDANSIMCYQIPGAITKNGKPILGGPDIDESDFSFMAKIYPKPSHEEFRESEGTDQSRPPLENLAGLRRKLLKAETERDILQKALGIVARNGDAQSEQDEGRATSFANDLAKLFTRSQISCMVGYAVYLDDYRYMSDPAGDAEYADHANARHVYARLMGTEGRRMPPGGPYWSPTMLEVYAAWMSEGFLP